MRVKPRKEAPTGEDGSDLRQFLEDKLSRERVFAESYAQFTGILHAPACRILILFFSNAAG